MADESMRAGLPAFVVYSVLAGGNAVGVRFSNFELEPFWGATFRFLLAAALMLIVMPAGRYSFPRGRELLGSIVYGVFAFGGAFAFAFYALVELEAGFGQIVLAVVPLATLLLGAVQGLETITATSVGGALVAVAGVAVMSTGMPRSVLGQARAESVTGSRFRPRCVSRSTSHSRLKRRS